MYELCLQIEWNRLASDNKWWWRLLPCFCYCLCSYSIISQGCQWARSIMEGQSFMFSHGQANDIRGNVEMCASPIFFWLILFDKTYPYHITLSSIYGNWNRCMRMRSFFLVLFLLLTPWNVHFVILIYHALSWHTSINHPQISDKSDFALSVCMILYIIPKVNSMYYEFWLRLLQI